MDIQGLIIPTSTVFDPGNRFEDVIEFFKASTFSHAAIVENEIFLGVLSENDLDTFEAGNVIDDYRDNIESIFVTRDTGWLDILEAFARNEANILYVLDPESRLLGYYDLSQVIRIFIDTPFFTEPGAIVIIAKGIKDYSFSEIAQIVESNNTRLLGAFITDTRNDVIQITVKIGTLHVNDVVQTFRRYNYSILFGNNDDQFLENLKERSNYLDKYLNV